MHSIDQSDAMEDHVEKVSPLGLSRQLGLASATALVAGECIAVGIFLTPASMAKSLGSPLLLLLVWLSVAGMTLSGALCYGELAGRFPRAGGTYVYLHEVYGRRIAFLYGWMCLLVLDPGLTAALATGAGGYAAYIFHWSAFQIKICATILIISLCLLNALSISISASLLRWVTWLKLATLALLIAWALGFHLGSFSNFSPFVAQRSGSLPLGPALAGALVAAFFSFGGWWDVSKIAGEVRDPVRTLPRAMLLGVGVVTLVYILISAIFLYLIPLQAVTSNDAFVAQVGEVLFGSVGGVVFASIVVICVLSGLAAFIMAAPRVYYAMARDGLFVSFIARLHPRFGTPANAILLQATVASALVWLGSFQQILSYFVFVAVLFLGLTVAGLFLVRSREVSSTEVRSDDYRWRGDTQEAKAAARVILTPGYPVTPVAFLFLVLGMLVLLLAHSPKETLTGTAVVLLGVPAYSLFQRNQKKSL